MPGARSVRCVGGVVHDEHGRLLLIRRGHAPSAGLWSLPGGKVEPGETDAVALRRELAEETGLAVHVGGLCGSVGRTHGDTVYDIHDYRCTVTAGTLRAGDDAAEAGWFDGPAFTRLARAGELTDGLAETLTSWHVLPR